MAERADALVLKQVFGSFAVCRFPVGTEMPHWFHPGGFASVTWTGEELSIVCDEAMVPEDVQCEREWSCLMLQGPFPFHMTGVLLQVLQPLAAARIGIFAISTFDTDYVLVKQHDFEDARRALIEAGMTVLR